jgi:hypothetical protein
MSRSRALNPAKSDGLVEVRALHSRNDMGAPRHGRSDYAELASAAKEYWKTSHRMTKRAELDRIAAVATTLAIGAELHHHERDPDRASALETLQQLRANALGTAIDEWLGNCEHVAIRELAEMSDVRTARDPDDVARAASLVLSRITELLA